MLNATFSTLLRRLIISLVSVLAGSLGLLAALDAGAFVALTTAQLLLKRFRALSRDSPSLTWTSDIYFPSLRCIRLDPGYSLRAIGHDFNNSIILCRPCLVKPFSNIFYDSDYFAGLTIRFMSLSFTRMVLTTVMPSAAFLTLSSSMAAAMTVSWPLPAGTVTAPLSLPLT